MRKALPGVTLLMLSGFLLLGAAQVTGQTPNDQGPQPITPAMEQKVDAMVQKLTLEQKLALIGGEDSMFIRAEPSIGFPRLKMSDGPMGVRTWGPSTAYAAGIGLAASWDRSLAKQVGVGLGEDARARNVNFLLGPGVDIYRAPMNGRNFEYFGEDPFLAGQIAVSYIDGVQSQGVSATVKHYDANNSEYDRQRSNSVIDERTLREIYLPAFEAAVKQGHVGAVMDSYNLINGEHATQNAYLNIQVLRKDWGFRGILMSDWGAAHDAIGVANGGLDLEMPSGEYMNAENLLPAIKNGQVTVATINEKVRHILQTAIRFGFLNRDQLDPRISLYNHHGNAIALQSAEEGAVLLKNEGHLLPLDRHAIHTIAVLGPDAYPAVPGAGGSSHVDAFAPVSFMTGLSDALYPRIKVLWNSGIVSPEDVFKNMAWCTDATCKTPGLNRDEYILSASERLLSTVDKTVDHQASSWMSEEIDKPRRVLWNGYFIPKTSGVYTVLVNGGWGDHYAVEIGGKPVMADSTQKGGLTQWASVTLQAGRPVQVIFNYFPRRPDNKPSLGIIAEDKLVKPEALQLAKMADVVVLSVGFDPATESEGFDRTYQLPCGQEKLIREVAAANPRTIVVLTSGGSVATQDWIDQVPAFLQTWYGGQQAGTALTKILFGEVDPSGKLPISWAKTVEENPTYNHYYEQPGTRNIDYSQGVFIGYRYFETSAVKPLFPFGFGLSYTTFTFSNLSVSPQTASSTGPIQVAFDVKNAGTVAGAEVAQIYVGDPSATVKRPKMELKGFSRVMLQPGEVRHVTATLDKRSLAYWDANTHAWKVDPGKFVVYVGDSSENVPLQKSFAVQ
jgi:beta-glucosidase